MDNIRKAYKESFLFIMITYFSVEFLPSLERGIKESFIVSTIVSLWSFIYKFKIVKFFFDSKFLAELCYESNFYKRNMKRVNHIARYIPRASLKFNGYYIGVLIGIVLILPQSLWNSVMWISIFTGVSIFYISQNLKERRGTVFVLINIAILIFMALISISVPIFMVSSFIYLIFGIDLFFLVSFSVVEFEDLKKILIPVFAASLLICVTGIVQNQAFGMGAAAVFGDQTIFGEILVVLFPFVFSYSDNFEKGSRKYLYMAVVFILFLNAVFATYSKAALLGLFAEVLIIAITNAKAIPFMLALVPFGLWTYILNLGSTVRKQTSYGNIITNLINMFKNLWDNSFGVNGNAIMEIYNSQGLKNAAESTLLKLEHIKIDPVYINFVIDIGAVFVLGFIIYLLRIAHSSFTSLFTADKKYTGLLSAGLAMLVGISVSALTESTFFNPRTQLVYWAMLGILRAVRILSMDNPAGLTNEK